MTNMLQNSKWGNTIAHDERYATQRYFTLRKICYEKFLIYVYPSISVNRSLSFAYSQRKLLVCYATLQSSLQLAVRDLYFWWYDTIFSRCAKPSMELFQVEHSFSKWNASVRVERIPEPWKGQISKSRKWRRWCCTVVPVFLVLMCRGWISTRGRSTDVWPRQF